MQLRNTSASFAFLGPLALVTACAAAPKQQLGQTEAAIRAAEEVGTSESPKAAYHLRLAKEQTEIARDMMNQEEEAALILMRAENDAELAMAYARTDQARRDAEQAWNAVRQLQAQSE